MEGFIKGDVVIVPFPFSDLSNFKKRPALVISPLKGEDLILCQITSQKIFDNYAVGINNEDFASGSLKVKSNVRPNRIFTADKKIILYKIGYLSKEKIAEIINRIIEIVKN